MRSFFEGVTLRGEGKKAKEKGRGEASGARGGRRAVRAPTHDPQAPDEQKKCFDLLKRTYIQARYNPGYRITKAQLEYLAERVKKLQRLTKKICAARIESYLST